MEVGGSVYRRVGEDGVGGISPPPPLLPPQHTVDPHGQQEADGCPIVQLLTIPHFLQPLSIIHLHLFI